MIRLALFFLGTIGCICFSWRALRNPGSHGFYRFFVFETILLLVLLNHPHWFEDPFSVLHLVSWSLLFASIFFVVQSVLMLKQKGGHSKREAMPENLTFENTAHVVEAGLYRYVRHPMYSSLLFLSWGTFLKNITPLSSVLVLLVSGLLIAIAKVEERENLRFFGTKYKDYMQRTRMFIPWLL